MSVRHAAAVGAVLEFAMDIPRGPQCELCARPIAVAHRHAVDVELRLGCVCDPCHLTLRNPAGRWMGIDDLRARSIDVPDVQIPVGLAFAMRSDADEVVVRYPGPAGGTVQAPAGGGWAAAATSLRPRIEALVVAGGRLRPDGQPAAWVIPVDRVHQVSGEIRGCWSGLDGGPAVTTAITDWVASLEREAPGTKPARRG